MFAFQLKYPMSEQQIPVNPESSFYPTAVTRHYMLKIMVCPHSLKLIHSTLPANPIRFVTLRETFLLIRVSIEKAAEFIGKQSTDNFDPSCSHISLEHDLKQRKFVLRHCSCFKSFCISIFSVTRRVHIRLNPLRDKRSEIDWEQSAHS